MLSRQISAWINQQVERCEAVSRDVLLSLCLHKPGATVVDVGCGTGIVTARVAQVVGATRTIGIDVVLDNAREVKRQGLEAILSNVDSGLPLRDQSVDCVILSHVIEHVSDTDKLVKECYRVLKPNGYVIAATPNLGALTNIAYLILGKQPPIVEVSDVALVGTWSVRGRSVGRIGPAHRRIFTPGALVGLFEYYGFKRDRVVMQGFLPLPEPVAGIASKLLPRYAWNVIARVRKP